MSLEQDPNIKQNQPGQRNVPRALRALVGLALVLPSSLCCLATLALPTFQTMLMSMQNVSIKRTSEFVGMENYSKLFESPIFGDAWGFTLLLTVERVLIAALVPLLLALAINEFGRKVRIPTRLLLSLPLAFFAPIAMALSWRLLLTPRIGLLEEGFRVLTDPQQARLALLGIDALSSFGLACGIGLAVYLIALRGTGDSPPTWKQIRAPLFITWASTLLATIALSLQSFGLSMMLTGGGPRNSTTSLTLLQYRAGFQQFQFGQGAAVATPVLLVLMLLGLIATVLIIITGLRLETVPPGKPAGLLGPSRKALAGIVMAVMVLGSLIILALGLLPPFWTTLLALKEGAEFQKANQFVSMGTTLFNTIGPTWIAVLLIQLPLTYLAALGIGALRPLGRYSEWLLLLFGPWLFVTVVPLSIVAFQGRVDAEQLNTFMGLLPPILISVPMLFVLTLFFKGQELKWRADQAAGQSVGSFFRTLILPSLPLAALLACIALAISQQELLWPLLVATKPDNMTVTLALARLGGQMASNPAIIATALILLGLPSLLSNLLVLGLFQIFYLDRLALARTTTVPQQT